MGKFDNLRHRPFMLITIAYRPKDGINTNVRGWREQPNAMQVIEKVDFHDRVSDRHLTRYSVIIDLFRGKVITSNLEGKKDQEVFDYFTNKYRDEVNESVGIYMRKLRDSGRRDLIMKEMNDFIELFGDGSLKEKLDNNKPKKEDKLVIENTEGQKNVKVDLN